MTLEVSLSPLILIVALPNSIHVARWLEAVRNAPFRFVLVPVTREERIPELGPLFPVDGADSARLLKPGMVGLWTGAAWGEADDMPAPIGMESRIQLARSADIAHAAELFQPALVHSMELQHAGYACFAAAQRMGTRFPRWFVSNWGSDLQLYRKLTQHQPVLAAIVRRMNAYVSECARDISIARELGYTGPTLDPIPASSGAFFATLPTLSDLPPPSARREIMIKGYHGWSGRALHVLSAVHLAAPHLTGFRIRVTLGTEPVTAMAAMIRDRDRLDIVMEPFEPLHAAALARLGSSRMTVGLGISDGISTTTLEAMALGSFPIVGTSSCAGEWLRAGQDGLLVQPHDVAGLARALEIAATDDRRVDDAAVRNRLHVEQHWDALRNGRRAAAIYRAILAPADSSL